MKRFVVFSAIALLFFVVGIQIVRSQTEPNSVDSLRNPVANNLAETANAAQMLGTWPPAAPTPTPASPVKVAPTPRRVEGEAKLLGTCSASNGCSLSWSPDGQTVLVRDTPADSVTALMGPFREAYFDASSLTYLPWAVGDKRYRRSQPEWS